ncbi:putative ribonuclease H-like domain-containing protein [Tanacetum coccineum]|uniref:Ribonuclease H-like domain-containing protein n=1 Tax=Tanacetum coccineum TaxID=301880 RepID=A0ABQ5HHH5_9ASTR
MLELHDATVSIEDANLKFLRSLPSVWAMLVAHHGFQTLGLDELDFDDLYNNLKVYEHELKGVSNSNSQNIAFLSTEVKGSTLKQTKDKEFMRKKEDPLNLKPKNGLPFDKSKIEMLKLYKLKALVQQTKMKILIGPRIFDARTSDICNDALTGVEQENWEHREFDAEHMHFGQDGLDDFDWSNKADDAPVSLALMATNSEVTKPSKLLSRLGQRELGNKWGTVPHKTQRPKKIVKSIWVKKGSIVGSQAVLPQTVKKNAMINPKQTWRPKGNYLDSVNRDNDSTHSSNFEASREDHKDYAIIEHGALELWEELKFQISIWSIVDEDLVILRAPRKNDVYSLDLKNIIPSGGITCLVAKATEDEAVLWHRRLGHVNFKNINKLVKGNLVRGLPSKTFKLDHSCLACRKGKQHRASCKKIEERTVREPLELLHMDLFGPVSVESINKKKYCLVVTDDCSKFSWVFFLAYKDETYDMLHDLIVGLENRLRHKVKTIRCDHGTEFKNQLMNEFCAKKGIKREYSIARTPQQNGVAERKNRTLIEAARTMLADSLLPIQFWAEAVNTACYVLNRVLDHLESFDGNSEEGYLLGYSTTQRGNKKEKVPDWMFDLNLLTPSMNYIPVRKENYAAFKRTKNICDEVEDFDDQQFIVHKQLSLASRGTYLLHKEVQLVPEEPGLIHDEHCQVYASENLLCKAHNDDQRMLLKKKRGEYYYKGKEHVNSNSMMIPKDGIFSTNSFDAEEGGVADYNNMDPTIDVPSTPTLRIHKIHPQSQIIGESTAGVQTRRKLKESTSDQHQALLSFIYKQNRTNHKDQQTCLFACFLSQEEPKKVSQALADESWVEAMQEELLQFKLQEVWVLCDLPEGKRVIGTKWVFRNKRDERVARIEAIRLFLAFASFMGFTVYQMDVKSAFLYGNITEEVYVKQPPGFEDPAHPNKVYVDDIIFGSTKSSMVKDFEDLMQKEFKSISQQVLTLEPLAAPPPLKLHKYSRKDEEGEDVDVHLYKSMIGCLSYPRDL